MIARYAGRYAIERPAAPAKEPFLDAGPIGPGTLRDRLSPKETANPWCKSPRY
jgi:hypothetical protein